MAAPCEAGADMTDQSANRVLVITGTSSGIGLASAVAASSAFPPILTPTTLDGLSRAVGEAHRRYTAFVNARARWTAIFSTGAMRQWRWTRRI